MRNILFDTAWGPAAFGVAAGTVLLFAFVFSLNWMSTRPVPVFLPIFLPFSTLGIGMLCGAVVFSAFVRALWKGQWGSAAVQAVLDAAAGVVLCIAADALFTHVLFGPWHSTGPEVPFPFAIECRNAALFEKGFHRRVAFVSGHRIPLRSGGGDIAVYALSGGAWLLDNSPAMPDSLRDDSRYYRVTPSKAKVELLSRGYWVPLPGSFRGIAFQDGPDVDVATRFGEIRIPDAPPLGDDFADRRYLGVVHSSGEFEPGDSGAD